MHLKFQSLNNRMSNALPQYLQDQLKHALGIKAILWDFGTFSGIRAHRLDELTQIVMDYIRGSEGLGSHIP